jgi:site-specific recombinase XerD
MIEDKFKKIEIEPAELSALVSSYLESCEMAKSTIRSRKFALRAFLEFHKTRKIFYFWPEHINKYRYHLEYKLKLSTTTIGNYLVGLNKFCDYLCDEKILEKNPVKRIKFKIKKKNISTSKNNSAEDLPTHKNNFVPLSKIENIIGIPANSLNDKRNKLLFLISIYSGVSVKFICSLKQNRLVKSERTYYIVEGETKNPIDVKINFLINDYLKEILTYESEYLFFSTAKNSFGRKLSPEFLRNILRDYFKLIKVDGSPMKLIHTTSMMAFIHKHKSRKRLIEKFGIKTNSVADKYMDLYKTFNS